MYEYLTDRPHIIVQGFKHAGIYSTPELLHDDIGIPDYTTTDDSDIDDDIEELIKPMASGGAGAVSN